MKENTCTINRWPLSQVCIGCKHGAFVDYPPFETDYVTDSMHICFKCLTSDGIECPSFEKGGELFGT
jgi:hypothetical protein